MSDGPRGRESRLHDLGVAAGVGLVVTLFAGSFAFGFSLRPSVASRVLGALYAPGLRLAAHLHMPSFVGWFVVAGLVNWMLYTGLTYGLASAGRRRAS